MSFDPSRLYSALLNTGLQTKDNALYQVIYQLITATSKLNTSITNNSGGSGSSTAIVVNELLGGVAFDGTPGEDSLIPGPIGPIGSQGLLGPMGLDGIDGNDSLVPGNIGIQGFTTGSVIFIGANGQLTQNNANLFFDNTNNRLGIGTALPATTLEVQNASGTAIKITQTGTGNAALNLVRSGGTASDWLIYLKPSTTSIAFFSGSDRVTFDTSGLITASALTLSSVITIGTNPATTGVIRIPNNTIGIATRNAANTGDIGIFTTDASDQAIIGFANVTNILFKPANTEQAAIIAGAGVRSIAAGAFYWTGRAVLLSPADAQITFSNQAQTSGFGLQMGTADVMIVANKAQSAYGTVDCLGLKASGTAGASYSGVPHNITVVNGIVTAAS